VFWKLIDKNCVDKKLETITNLTKISPHETTFLVFFKKTQSRKGKGRISGEWKRVLFSFE